jgi:signal transduction histidine kinase
MLRQHRRSIAVVAVTALVVGSLSLVAVTGISLPDDELTLEAAAAATDPGTSISNYSPSSLAKHVGGFLLAAVIVFALGVRLFLRYQTRGAQLIAVALGLVTLRLGSDLVHLVLGPFWTFKTALLSVNELLELGVALAVVAFAIRYTDEARYARDSFRALLVGMAIVGAIPVVTAPVHAAMFVTTTRVLTPFGYVAFDPGVAWWGLALLKAACFTFGAGLLASQYTQLPRVAWRSTAVLVIGIGLSVFVAASSVTGRVPVPGFNYVGVATAAFVVTMAASVLGHGLRRIEITARDSVLEELEDAILVCNDRRVVLDYNRAAATLFPDVETGRRAEEVVDAAVEYPAIDETTKTEIELDRPAEDPTDAAGGDDGSDDAPDADARHFLVQTTAISAQTNDVVGYTLRFADVTRIKRYSERLERKNEQLDQFVGTVSQDLRQPLSTAREYLGQMKRDLYGEEVADASRLRSNLSRIGSSLTRMETIIEDLLTIARSDEEIASRDTLDFRPVAATAWEHVETRDATLTVGATGTIDADEESLLRIFENLYRSVVEHGDGPVTVTVALTDDGFTVTAAGPGHPPAVDGDVFANGFGSDDDTGLQLSIVDQLATAHGWSVTFDAADAATFVFTRCETDVESSSSASQQVDTPSS